jgi:RimJ/RimL family protein N-acetyltransferase
MATRFRLVQCDVAGQPIEPVGPMLPALKENCEASAKLLSRLVFQPPWVSYVSISGTVPVGGGAFVGAPKDGRVEIAYFTLREFENMGHGRQTAWGLVSIVRSIDASLIIFAKTLPETNASNHILRKLGFALKGDTADEDVGHAWLWELDPG